MSRLFLAAVVIIYLKDEDALNKQSNVKGKEILMFCFQCEQTVKGEGCTKLGVCGKKPEVAALQDLLLYTVKGISLYAVEGRKVGVEDAPANAFTCEALFFHLDQCEFRCGSFCGPHPAGRQAAGRTKGKS